MKINLLFAISAIFLITNSCKTDTPKKEVPQTKEIRQWKPEDTRAIAGNRAERGLISKSESATTGYVLFSPYTGTTTFLMDKDGKIVHEWNGELSATLNGYLLENGHLILALIVHSVADSVVIPSRAEFHVVLATLPKRCEPIWDMRL